MLLWIFLQRLLSRAGWRERGNYPEELSPVASHVTSCLFGGLGVQDPYVVAKVVDPSGALQSQGRSGSVAKGGKDPVWTSADGNSIPLSYTLFPGGKLMLALEVRDQPEDKVEAPGKVICSGEIPLDADALLTQVCRVEREY